MEAFRSMEIELEDSKKVLQWLWEKEKVAFY
jgi:hypothetical protein